MDKLVCRGIARLSVSIHLAHELTQPLHSFGSLTQSSFLGWCFPVSNIPSCCSWFTEFPVFPGACIILKFSAFVQLQFMTISNSESFFHKGSQTSFVAVSPLVINNTVLGLPGKGQLLGFLQAFFWTLKWSFSSKSFCSPCLHSYHVQGWSCNVTGSLPNCTIGPIVLWPYYRIVVNLLLYMCDV